MNKLITSVLLICALTTPVAHAKLALSPNQNNGSGQIPSGDSDITFTLSPGNSASQVYLPSTPALGDKVTIVNNGSAFNLDVSNTDIPLESLQVYSTTEQKNYTFTSNPYKRGWSFQPDSIALTNNIIPITTVPKIYAVTINDVNWQSEFDFAVHPTNEDKYLYRHLVKVVSTASKTVSIKSNNTLYPGGSFVLNKNESLWFEYLPKVQKWVRVGFDRGVKNSIAQLPTVFDSRFYTNYLQGSLKPHVLPSVAADRAEAFIGSSSIVTENPIISKVNTSYPVDMMTSDLKDRTTGRAIDLFTKNKTLIHYIYVADRQHWVPLSLKPIDYSSNITTYGSTNVIEYFGSPIVYVKFDNSNYVSDFNLNTGNGIKNTIILENTTNQSINVALGQGRSEKLLPGERARFQYSNGFNPVKVSNTIDLLLVNSPEVSNAIGASAAKIRFLEAVAATNQISENSNANMYLRVAGYLEHATTHQGSSLDWDFFEIANDSRLQAEMEKFAADGLYYQSGKGGGYCGMATVRALNSKNMKGVVGYDCPIMSMAHEVGHNLGLQHTEKTGFDPDRYQKGFYNAELGKSTIMNELGEGSGFPYYSSPNLYDSRYLSRMGDDINSDSVKQINRYAPIISAFATATQQ